MSSLPDELRNEQAQCEEGPSDNQGLNDLLTHVFRVEVSRGAAVAPDLLVEGREDTCGNTIDRHLAIAGSLPAMHGARVNCDDRRKLRHGHA